MNSGYIGLDRLIIEKSRGNCITILFEPGSNCSDLAILDYFPPDMGVNLIIPQSEGPKVIKALVKSRQDVRAGVLAYPDGRDFKSMGYVLSSAIEIAKSAGAEKLLLLNNELVFYHREERYEPLSDLAPVIKELFAKVGGREAYRQGGIVAKEDSSALLHKEPFLVNTRTNRIFCLDIRWLIEKSIFVDAGLAGKWEEDLTLQILEKGGKNFAFYKYAQKVQRDTESAGRVKFLEKQIAALKESTLMLASKWPKFTKLRDQEGARPKITVYWKSAANYYS